MINNFGKASLAYPDCEYPPGFYIEQLSKSAHSSIQTYIKLWRLRDDKNYVYIFKDEILPFLSMTKPKFYDDIAHISNEGLLNWKEEKISTDDITRMLITLELTGWSDEMYD